MNARIWLLFMLLLSAGPARTQDSVMVKKPPPADRKTVPMPTRWGKGTAQDMPSPRYKSRMVPIRPDTSRRQSRRDTSR